MHTFAEILDRTGDIVRQSSCVQTDEAALETLVQNWPSINVKNDIVLPENLSFEQKLMFVFIWGLSDFCYWPYPEWGNSKDKAKCPSSVLSACYTRALSEGTDILNPIIMSDLSLKRYRQLTHIDSPCRLCFSSWRWLFIRHGMRILQENYQGRIFVFLRSCQFDAQKIVWALSREFLGLNDRWLWHNKQVDFLHRAQKITWWWNQIYITQTGHPFLHADHLNLGADDKTPWALGQLKIVKLSADLKKAILRGVPIPAGSPWELVLRSVGVKAIDSIKKLLRQNGNASSDNVEQVLWLLAQNNFQEDVPPHKTLTWFY